MSGSPNITIRRRLLFAMAVAAFTLTGVAQGATGPSAPPQSAIDTASATWAAKAALLDAYGHPLFAQLPPVSAIDTASATWAAKAKLLDAYGRPLPSESETTATASSSGFDWGDFGIGVGAMLGLVLIAGGLAAGAHYSHKAGVHVRPAS